MRRKPVGRPRRCAMSVIAAKPRAKARVPVTMDDEGMWKLISKKAYELYEERGGQDGFALDDWLEAEKIVMGELHEARE
jgi:hypothetical protein